MEVVEVCQHNITLLDMVLVVLERLERLCVAVSSLVRERAVQRRHCVEAIVRTETLHFSILFGRVCIPTFRAR